MRAHSIRRRVLSFVLILCLLVPFAAVSTSASAASEGRAVGAALSAADFPRGAVTTPVLLNGDEVLAGECYRLDGVTYVPLRRFCDIFAPNGTMTWDGTTSTARFRTDKLDLSVRVGRLYITANGHSLYTVGAVRNLAGHLYVPIRPLARAFAAALKWDAAAGAVDLTRTSGSSAIARASYDADEVYWLSRIISAEASVEPFVGQIAVGNVVLNRVRSREFPNTIYGVIFDRKHGTQFSPVAFGTIYETPEPSCVIAAQICLEGYSVTDTALYFFDPDLSTSDWISRNCVFEFRIGSHEFYH
ncbi:MAG TPA: copper amine oxidase [Clostridiales bacterium]|nr:copper amine oxidase [Clostridiales bacterium]